MDRKHFIRALAGASALGFVPGRAGAASSQEFDRAKMLVRALRSRDDDRVRVRARTNCYDHGHQTELAVVLFHGFTNNPEQFARLAAELYANGCNVLVPRLPGHGDIDRMSMRLEGVTAVEFMAFAMEAVDAARGLGSKLALSGISLGGTLCAWLATRRPDVDRCVCVAPALALNRVAYAVDRVVVGALTSLPPDRYAWWDPHVKEKIEPEHAYPRYPLRTLGECYRIGEVAIDAKGPFPGRGKTRVTFLVNPLDVAVNNQITQSVADRWRTSDWIQTDFVSLAGLPAVHDVVDPENPQQQVAFFYPKLIDLITDHLHMK
jgi:pimeloyl-ACP methyl ester carboxylesterase